jgi:MbtH protein
MNHEDGNEAPGYQVLINESGQYSIWKDNKEIPAGWRAEGLRGTKGACIEHIDTVWTDMRPLGLKQTEENNTQLRQ